MKYILTFTRAALGLLISLHIKALTRTIENAKVAVNKADARQDALADALAKAAEASAKRRKERHATRVAAHFDTKTLAERFANNFNVSVV